MSSRLNLNPPAPGALVNLATTATPAARRCTTISASARSAALSIPEVFNMAYLRTPTGLLIHHAAFAAAPVRPESQEIATIGGGGDYQIYREVLRDDQVKAAFAQRQLAVVSKDWEVRAGGTKRIDKQAADFLTKQLQAVNFDRVAGRRRGGGGDGD